MSKLNVETVKSTEERNLPIFREFNTVAERIRDRAFDLFAGRGFLPGNDLDDWLLAEREICWPSAELVEDDDEFEVKVALAGFKPKEISVAANPRELIIKAAHHEKHTDSTKKNDGTLHWSEFSSEDVYRRITLPSDVDTDKISAEFEHGVLEIEAPKVKSGGKDSGKKKTRNVKVS